MTKAKIMETSLVLTTGFLLLYFLTQNKVFIYLAFIFGFIGIFIKGLARLIAIGWFKLADGLNFVVSKLILGFIFYVILFPISLLYKLSKKDKLNLKNRAKSNWIERNTTYSAADLENIW